MHHLYTLRNDNVESNTKAGKANYSCHTDWKKTEENYVDTHNTFQGFFQDNGTFLFFHWLYPHNTFSSGIPVFRPTSLSISTRNSGNRSNTIPTFPLPKRIPLDSGYGTTWSIHDTTSGNYISIFLPRYLPGKRNTLRSC